MVSCASTGGGGGVLRFRPKNSDPISEWSVESGRGLTYREHSITETPPPWLSLTGGKTALGEKIRPKNRVRCHYMRSLQTFGSWSGICLCSRLQSINCPRNDLILLCPPTYTFKQNLSVYFSCLVVLCERISSLQFNTNALLLPSDHYYVFVVEHEVINLFGVPTFPVTATVCLGDEM